MDPEVWDLFKTSWTKILSGSVVLVVLALRHEGRGVEDEGARLVGPTKAIGMSSGRQISDKTFMV